MSKKCIKCGSENVIKIVPAASMVIPEVKQEVKEGRAKVSCCCAGGFSGTSYKCKDCGFKWDSQIEEHMEKQQEE